VGGSDCIAERSQLSTITKPEGSSVSLDAPLGKKELAVRDRGS
jgi:hypothetical protein